MTVKLLSPESKHIAINELPVLGSSEYILSPFEEITLSFFDSLSKAILSSPSVMRIPEMTALGFWVRRKNLENIKAENSFLFESKSFRCSPLGKVFHICPANVDTMFIYSLVVSMLMGNKNILRISERMNAPHINILFDILNSLLAKENYSVFQKYINIISYAHDESISTFLSENCNARIIWGGDNTVSTFKKIKTAPRTKDIVFADRISVLFIDCESFLKVEGNDLQKFCMNFFNDAYTFDQMGCSSPQSIYFIGNEDAYHKALKKISSELSSYITSKYDTDISSLASLKFNRLTDDSIEDRISSKSGDNYLTFVELNDEVSGEMLHSCGGGYFYVKRVTDLTELGFIRKSKYQTVTHYKLKDSDLQNLLGLSNGEGIDRIVPLGESLNFNFIWDGYNLLDELSKKVYFKF